LVPGFYAAQNTWYPALAGAISLIAHYFLARWWVEAYGLQGLMTSTTVAAGINMLLLAMAFRWLIGRLPVWPILKSLVPMIPAALIMGFIVPPVYGWLYSRAHIYIGMNLAQVTAVLFSTGLGAVFYIYVTYRLNCAEAAQFVGLIARRLHRK
jgi:peptidoglycan biosynthesis protein MviN/MurJ (putative lipid II flippase)